MGTLSLNIKPRITLSEKAVPKALHQALKKIFDSVPKNSVWLVGGTALAGFYAEHRRSDDLDLFANEEGFETCILAVKALLHEGAQFDNEIRSKFYYRTFCTFHQHQFTIDVVKDTFLHQEGLAHESKEGIFFANFQTLFGMKASTLVSRSSEKDLFDLKWMFDYNSDLEIQDLVREGMRFDGGVTIETLLIGLRGAILREEACGFLLKNAKKERSQVFKEIESFRKLLIKKLLDFEKKADMNSTLKILKSNLKDYK